MVPLGRAANDRRVGQQQRIRERVIGLDEDELDAFVRTHAPRLSRQAHDRIRHRTTRLEQRGIGTLAAAHARMTSACNAMRTPK